MDFASVRSQLRLRDASVFLKRHGANAISGCFVSPNARCPVCSAPVFYYENDSGSRVFFDDLGPPWPKHPCTDNRLRLGGNMFKSSGAPKRRLPGLIQELIASANVVGAMRNKVFGSRRRDEWAILIVRTVKRRGNENIVNAEYLDSVDGEVVAFSCFSDFALFSAGDFVSERAGEYSFMHPHSLLPVFFENGAVIEWPSVPSAPVETSPAKRVVAPVGATKVRLLKRSLRGPAMRKVERRHFESRSVSLEQFRAKLLPVVKTFIREGTVSPSDMAVRLNHAKIKTACGEMWTSRLAQLALNFVEFPQGKRRGATKSNKPNRAAQSSVVEAVPPKIEQVPITMKQGPSGLSPKVGKGDAKRGPAPVREVERSVVKQSFSHGRTKLVSVEKRRSMTRARSKKLASSQPGPT